jgi:hypothetical protein
VVFDKEIDRLVTFLPEFVEEHALSEDAQEPLKVRLRTNMFTIAHMFTNAHLSVQAALQEAFKAKRATEEASFRAMQEEVATMSPETQKALREMRTLKFYPWHPELPIAPFVDDLVNPYFGRATRVLLPSPEEAEQLSRAHALEQADAAAAAATPSKRSRGTPKRARDASPAAAAEPPAPGAEPEKKAKVDE